MSDNDERHSANAEPAAPSLTPSPYCHDASGPKAAAEGQQGHQVAREDELTAELKKHLEETRLPLDLKEQILALLPSPEEQDRMYRELQEKGGLSSEEFLSSLGLEDEPQQ